MLLVICCTVGLAGACTSKSVMLNEKQLVASVGSNQNVMYEPVSLETARGILPFSFQTPSFLPYTPKSATAATIRKFGDAKKQNLIVNVKYLKETGKQDGYIELTVANFSYNMDLIKKYKLFDEDVSLANGIKAYFKFEQTKSQPLLSLTWNVKEIDYQLLYRCKEGADTEAAKSELLQVANQMKKA